MPTPFVLAVFVAVPLHGPTPEAHGPAASTGDPAPAAHAPAWSPSEVRVCDDLRGPVSVLAPADDRDADHGALGVEDDELRALYRGGRSYEDFLERATRRRALWDGNTEKAGSIDADLVARARAVGGSWRLLAVAVDSCSDSVSTIPYLAELVSLVDGLDMRIVDSTVGRSIMESHRTPDGRAATPTVLLLNDDFDDAGCFIERPPTLQTWILENNGSIASEDLYEHKMAWYDDDGGQETVATVVAMLEAAARGDRICG